MQDAFLTIMKALKKETNAGDQTDENVARFRASLRGNDVTYN